jgi:hypothetical protein
MATKNVEKRGTTTRNAKKMQSWVGSSIEAWMLLRKGRMLVGAASVGLAARF